MAMITSKGDYLSRVKMCSAQEKVLKVDVVPAECGKICPEVEIGRPAYPQPERFMGLLQGLLRHIL